MKSSALSISILPKPRSSGREPVASKPSGVPVLNENEPALVGAATKAAPKKINKISFFMTGEADGSWE
jgi:hypothetical protein